MKLISLSLENFRQHRATQLNFQDGVTGIIGPNGAGKTTLIEAIAFALFGSRAIRGKIGEVKCSFAPASAELSVTLSFEHDGVNYRLMRSDNDGELYHAGESVPITRGNRDVTNRISQLLRMSYEEFVATYYTEQKGLEFLSSQKGATERERFILKLLGYDRFERIQNLLRQDRRDKKNSIAGWENALGNKAELEARLQDEILDRSSLENRLKEAESSLKKSEEEERRLKRTFLEWEERKKKWDALNKANQESLTRKDERGARLKRLIDKHSESSNTVLKIRKKLKIAKDDSIEDVRSKYELSFQTALEKEESVALKLEMLREQHRSGLSDYDSKSFFLNSQLEQLVKKQLSLSELDPNQDCPTCGQRLEGSHALVLPHLKSEEKELKAKIKDLNTKRKELEPVAAQIKVLEAEISQIKVASKGIRENLAELSQFQGFFDEIVRFASEIKEVEGELQKLEESISVTQNSLKETKFSENEYRGCKAAYDSAASLCQVLRLQRLKIEGELSTKTALLQRTKSEIVELEDRIEKLNLAKQELLILEESDLLLTEFRKHINSSVRPRLAELASEFLSELTDGRYNSVDVAVDFSPTVLEDGEPKSVISGGEEDILNLCMRLALSQMLAERAGHTFSLLMLDEVFGSLDEQRRTNLLTLLDKLSHRFEQVIIITHLDDVKEGVRNLIYLDFDDGTEQISLGMYDHTLNLELSPEREVFNL